MTNKEIKSLFPKKVNITAGMIKKAKTWDMFNCIGALTLKKVFKDHKSMKDFLMWSNLDGYIESRYGRVIVIGTKEHVEMMDVYKPITVTLIVKN